jgi:predicted DNA-binding transcriptional regulator AlpA
VAESRPAHQQTRKASPTRHGTCLTIADICAELQIARSTFYEWRRKGRGPRCLKLPNGDLRISRAEFDRWLAAHEDAA